MSNDRDGERVGVFETVDSRGEGSGWGQAWSTTSSSDSKHGEHRRRGEEGPAGDGTTGEGAHDEGVREDAWRSIIDSIGRGGLTPAKRGPVVKLPPTHEQQDTRGHDRAGGGIVAAIAAAEAMSAIVTADPDIEPDDGEVPEVSRKVKARPRHRRRERPRSKTIALKRLTRDELRRGALAHPPVEGVERPHTRAECRDAPRPCPWVACKHHLYLDINPRTGSIKINFPDLEPWELQHTCALDVADGGGLTLEEIGFITNLTRERVRQVEVRGLLTLKARSSSLR